MISIKSSDKPGTLFCIRLSGDCQKHYASSNSAMIAAVKHYYVIPHKESICPLCPESKRRIRNLARTQRKEDL
jgi:hypothetical protein